MQSLLAILSLLEVYSSPLFLSSLMDRKEQIEGHWIQANQLHVHSWFYLANHP